MKKLITAFLVIVICLVFFAPFGHAQESGLLLVLTDYQTAEQKEQLFNNSRRVWDYFEGEDVDKPLFLSLMTEKQRQILIKEGLTPRILDSRPDLSRYFLLAARHPSQVVNQEELKKLGKVTKLPPYYYLLKLTKAGKLPVTGEVAKLVQIPLPEKYVKPVISSLTPRQPPPTAVLMPGQTGGSPRADLASGIFVVIYLAGVGFFLLILQWKKKLTKASLIFILLITGLIVLFLWLPKRRRQRGKALPSADIEIDKGIEF